MLANSSPFPAPPPSSSSPFLSSSFSFLTEYESTYFITTLLFLTFVDFLVLVSKSFSFCLFISQLKKMSCGTAVVILAVFAETDMNAGLECGASDPDLSWGALCLPITLFRVTGIVQNISQNNS